LVKGNKNKLSLADYFSLMNAIFGFLGIIVLFLNIIPDEIKFRISISFLLLAIIADGLDGIIARKTFRSEVGEHLDSMADMTSMGIATSIFVYLSYHDIISNSFYSQIYLIFALVFFISSAIIRLSSYYKIKKENYFIGLPAPASSIIILMLAYIRVDFIFILPIIIIISATMICNIHFPKPKIKIDIIATLLILITLIIGDYLNFFAPVLLLAAMILYAIGGPIYLKIFGELK
jgi:CDP-diacylglycerol--serine O-phosphatidyltransferase